MNIRIYRKMPKCAREIRTEVFVKEQGFEREFDDADARALHAVGYENGRPVAVARMIVDARDDVMIGRFAVRREARRTGAGSALMNALLVRAKKAGFVRAHVDAQLQAEPFYAKCGFLRVSDETHYDQHVLHVRMQKSL